jgi:tyrosinase
MWPWNGVTGAPRPPTAPRQPLAGSPVTTAPDPRPTIGSMVDYQGKVDPATFLGFGYDDVPF